MTARRYGHVDQTKNIILYNHVILHAYDEMDISSYLFPPSRFNRSKTLLFLIINLKH